MEFPKKTAVTAASLALAGGLGYAVYYSVSLNSENKKQNQEIVLYVPPPPVEAPEFSSVVENQEREESKTITPVATTETEQSQSSEITPKKTGTYSNESGTSPQTSLSLIYSQEFNSKFSSKPSSLGNQGKNNLLGYAHKEGGSSNIEKIKKASDSNLSESFKKAKDELEKNSNSDILAATCVGYYEKNDRDLENTKLRTNLGTYCTHNQYYYR